MTLVLQILAKDKTQWSLYQAEQLIASQIVDKFEQQDNFLASLDQLLQQQNIHLDQIESMALLVKEASLTQVKLATAIINALAWTNNKPVAGNFFYQTSDDKALAGAFIQLAKQQSFAPLSVKYLKPVDITISKKVNKFSLT